MGVLDNFMKAAGQAVKSFKEGRGDAPPEDVSDGQMVEALQQAGLAEPTDERPRALFHDPYAVMDWAGWRERPSALTYETLRQMSVKCTAVAAIIQVRTNQVSAFSHSQQGRYDRGFRVILRDRRDQKRGMSKQEALQAAMLERMLESTGVLSPDEKQSDRDSFSMFLKKAVRDILTYDQWCHPAGTLIQMADGSLCPIECVEIGDYVITHRGRAKRVVERMNRSYTGEMVRLRYRGQEVLATKGHPFYVRQIHKEPHYEREWVEAGELREGDYLTSPDVEPIDDQNDLSLEMARNPTVHADGYHYLKINKAEFFDVTEVPVFNLEVEEDHSYIANGVASHNCVELLRDRRGKVSKFIALPSATIRPAVADVEHMDPAEMRNRVSHVQVYEDTVIAEFSPDDIAWCIANPRSDLRANGFGYSPIEQLTTLITAWLFGFEYNCLSGSSLIHTDEGMVPLADLSERKFRIWDGEGWFGARAYETGRKQRAETHLLNGVKLVTSPDHRFRVISEDSEFGEIEWKDQRDLCAGDYVLVDNQPVDASFDAEALGVGKTYEAHRTTMKAWEPSLEVVNDKMFWEMIGFALGDGHWAKNQLQIFPHYERDAELFDRFKTVCARHGISIQDGEVRGGDSLYPCLRIFHTAFLHWLYDLGFRKSSEGKRIPSELLSQPEWIRAALLRGLFSADGHTRTHPTGYRTPTMCCVNPAMRHDILMHLMSLGIAATDQDGGGTVRVQDVTRFVDTIGYLQRYKDEGIERAGQSAVRWDLVHPAVCARVVELVRSHAKWLELPMKIRQVFYTATLKGSAVSRPRLIEALKLLGEPIPEELHRQVAVKQAFATREYEQMFDVEVFNDRHLFFANGMGAHNTKFFTNGAAIKGVLNVKGAIPDRQLKAFRRMWYSMISGVNNAWRTPILNSEDIQWVSMHANNREMEFSAWMDWLTKLSTAIFGMDPMEINFIYGNTGQRGGMNQSRPNMTEIIESKDKGLRPLLDFIEECINKHIIWDLNPDFEFSFTGVNSKEEEQQRKGWLEEVKGYKTVNEVRAELDLDPVEFGDVVLDATYLQNKSASQQQQQPGAEGGGEGEGEGKPMEELEPGAEETDEGELAGEGEAEEGGGAEGEGEAGFEEQAEKSIDAALTNVYKLLHGEPLRKSRVRKESKVDTQVLDILIGEKP